MRLATALTASIMAAAPALAADFPVLRGSQQPDYAPRIGDAGPIWEGFYIGGHAGYSEGRFGKFTAPNHIVANQFRLSQLESEAAVSSWLNLRGGVSRSPVFGAFAGYNWQFGEAVFGLEADFSTISVKTTATDSIGRLVTTSNGYVNNVNLTATSAAEINGYGTIRTRMGWAAGWYMPYITGGVAIGRGKYSTTVNSTLNATNPGGALPDVNRAFSDTAANGGAWTVGGTVGAGVDILVANNVLLRGEYQFVRFGSVSALPIDIHAVRGAVGVKF